jgi:farnesyl-diphosphate farnesyltransferase
MEVDDLLFDLLHKTSRTFALTIPLLPEPTRRQVGVAYLLFRIIDSFEDATLWTAAKRVEALNEFSRLIDRADPRAASAAAARWIEDPPLEHAGYLELIEQTPRVLQWHGGLGALARQAIRDHLLRTAQGMARFVARGDGSGALRLETPAELHEYCFVVAGIVGELLTELYLLGSPRLDEIAGKLRARAARFGEGLQLVNILKDVQPDAAQGRVYLPRELTLPQVFALAREDLLAALEYTELLRWAEADFGVIAFNALNARLALATLEVLSAQGLGSKLTRQQLKGVIEDVLGSIRAGASLLPERELQPCEG